MIVTVELDAPFLFAVSVHLVKVSKVREGEKDWEGEEKKGGAISLSRVPARLRRREGNVNTLSLGSC